jgi:hypothetical protein
MKLGLELQLGREWNNIASLKVLKHPGRHWIRLLVHCSDILVLAVLCTTSVHNQTSVSLLHPSLDKKLYD